MKDLEKIASDDKYPWGNIKHKFMVFLSFFTFFMGTMFYGLDIHTDIRFSLDMFNYSKLNFTKELRLCQADFDIEFSSTIEKCRDNLNTYLFKGILLISILQKFWKL